MVSHITSAGWLIIRQLVSNASGTIMVAGSAPATVITKPVLLWSARCRDTPGSKRNSVHSLRKRSIEIGDEWCSAIPFFSVDFEGKIRSWQFEVDGGRWRTISGLIDGEKVETGWTVCVPKSQDTVEEQALFEARAEEKKKLDRKYARTIEEIDVPKAAGVKPMLAHKYEGWVGHCYSQPKLDGIRCTANKDGLWSRTGKAIVSCPHIIEVLEPLFDRHPQLVLDGELYNHSLRENFNEITSVVKKTKPTEEDFAKAADLIQSTSTTW